VQANAALATCSSPAQLIGGSGLVDDRTKETIHTSVCATVSGHTCHISYGQGGADNATFCARLTSPIVLSLPYQKQYDNANATTTACSPRSPSVRGPVQMSSMHKEEDDEQVRFDDKLR